MALDKIKIGARKVLLTDSQKKFIEKHVVKKRLLRRTWNSEETAQIGVYLAYNTTELAVEAQLATLAKLDASAHDRLSRADELIRAIAVSRRDYLNGDGALRELQSEIQTAIADARRAAMPDVGSHDAAAREFRDKIDAIAARERPDYDRLDKLLADDEGGRAQVGSDFTDAHNAAHNAVRRVVEQGSALPIDTARTAMQSALDDFASEAERLGRIRDGLLGDAGARRTELADQGRRSQFDTALASGKDTLSGIESMGHPRAADFAKALSDIQSQADRSRDYAVGIDQLKRWEGAARTAIEASDAAFDQQAARYGKVVAQLRSGLEGIDASVPQAQREQLADVIAMANLTLEGAKNEGALAPLTALLRRGADLLKELQQAQAINAETQRHIDAIARTLGAPEDEGGKNAAARAVLPRQFAPLRTAFESLLEERLSQPPATAHTAAHKLAGDVAALQASVDARLKWQEGARDRHAAANRAVQQLNLAIMEFGTNVPSGFERLLATLFGRSSETYEGELRTDLDDAAEMIDVPDRTLEPVVDKKIADAHAQATKYVVAVNKLRAVRDHEATLDQSAVLAVTELVADHQRGVAEREALEARKREVEMKLEAFREMLSNAKSDSSLSDAALQDIGRIEGMLKAVESQLESDEIDTALAMITRARNMLADAMSRPEQAASKAELLSKIGTHWGHGVTAFRARLDELRDAVLSAVETDGMEGAEKTAIVSALDDLVRIGTKLDTTAFDGAAGVLGDADATPKARKRAREEALRAVSLWRDYVSGNDLVTHAALNPFGVARVRSTVMQALAFIELEVLRGV